MKFIVFPLVIALAGCGTEQSQPVPVTDPDAWGKLDLIDPRPLQAENVPPTKPERRA